MTSISSSSPTFIVNPTVVEVKDRLRPIFKEDSIDTLLRVLDGIVYMEDVRAYIHYTLEDLGIEEIKGMYQFVILGSSRTIKLEYQIIEDLGLTGILYIPKFKDEMIRYILSKVHHEFIWLDLPHMITKEVIQAVTILLKVGQEPGKKISNTEVEKLIGATHDRRSMRVNTIKDTDVKFSSMIIGYKVTQSSRLNSITSSYIHVAYQMINNDGKYDLCEWLRSKLMINLGKIKGVKKGTFRFGNLNVYLMLYFMNELPHLGKKR